VSEARPVVVKIGGGLLRAQETASRAISRMGRDVPIETRDSLVEAAFGKYLEGVPQRRAVLVRPLIWVHLVRPGALTIDESVDALADRVDAVCREALAACRGEAAALVDLRPRVSLDTQRRSMGTGVGVEGVELGGHEWLSHLGGDRGQAPGARVLLDNRLDAPSQVPGRQLLQHANVVWQQRLAICAFRHGVFARVAGDRVEDPSRARLDRAAAEVHQRLGDPVQRRTYQLRVLPQLTPDAG